MAYLKPQSPIKYQEDHIYPLTTVDQIIMNDGSRLSGVGVYLENPEEFEDTTVEVGLNADTLGGIAASDYVLETELDTYKTEVSSVYATKSEVATNYLLKTETADDSNLLGGKAPAYYIQPRNLLDNSDFTNPVNQREQTSYNSTSAVYGIDRWLVGGGASITLTTDGIILANPSSYNRGLEQVLEYRDGTYTIAALVNGLVCTRTFTLAGGTVTHGTNYANSTGFQPYISKGSVDGYYRIALQLITGHEAITIKWVALYEGEYTVDTLPPYVPKGYGVELMECQRYFVRYVANWTSVSRIGGYGIVLSLYTPVSMRDEGSPTVTITNGRIYETTKGWTQATYTAIRKSSNRIDITLTAEDATAFQNGFTYLFEGTIDLSCDL